MKIRDLTILVSGNGWDEEGVPSLSISVKTTSDARDISMIHFKYRTDDEEFEDNISIDLIECISTQFNSRHHEEIWREMNPTDISLLLHLKDVRKGMTYQEAGNVGSLMMSIAKDEAVSIDVEQSFADAFVAGVAVYLSFVSLLYGTQVWRELPFVFDLPFSHFDGRSLTYSSMKALSSPLDGLRVLGSYWVSEVSSVCKTFFNDWGSEWVEGDPVAYDSTSLFINSVISACMERMKKEQGSTLEECSRLSTHLDEREKELNEKIDKLRSSISILADQYSLISQALQEEKDHRVRLETELSLLRSSLPQCGPSHEQAGDNAPAE